MKKISENLALLKRIRQVTLSLAAELTQQQLDWQPAEGKWSAGEHLDHLLLAERLYRDAIANLIERVKAGGVAELRLSFEDLNMRPNLLPKETLPLMEIPLMVGQLFMPRALKETMIRYRILDSERPDSARPDRGKGKDELLGELHLSLNQTKELIEANPDLDFHNMTLQHPLLGWNDVPFLVKLTALHEERHQRHIEELLAAWRKRPKPPNTH